jgi:hypothetical protein
VRTRLALGVRRSVCVLVWLCALLGNTAIAEPEQAPDTNAEVECPTPADDAPAPVEADERILDFHSRVVVAADGGLTVTETIGVVATGDRIEHGIYRDFPTIYRGPWFTRRVVPFDVLDVRRDDHAEPFHLGNQDNGVRVYFGREDVKLPPGRYTYTLTYHTARQLGFFADHDELYWNVTGNGWAFPIDRASASIVLPANIPRQQVTVEGYTGEQGSKERALTATVDARSGELDFATTAPLDPYQGLTIVASFPKGFIEPPSASAQRAELLRTNPVLLVGPIGLLLVVLYYGGAWLLVGRDPARGTIIPLFEPPLDLDAPGLRYVAGMGYDERCFTAALVGLAVKGWARIDEKSGQYTLVRLAGRHTPIGAGERRVNDILLSGDRFELKQANHSTLRSAIQGLRETLQRQYDGKMFLAHRRWLIPGLVLSVLAVLVAGFAGPAASSVAFGFMLVWLSAWTFACCHLGITVWSAWRAVMQPGAGTFSRIGSGIAALLITAFALPFFAGEGFGLFALTRASSVWMAPVMVVLIGMNFLFFHLLKQPTLAGRTVMDQIDGFRMYLTTAEGAELAQAAPAKTPQLYERLLPYAIALGVENAWAEQFGDVLRSAARSGDGTGYQPSWYRGVAFSQLGAATFGSALSASLSTSIASSSTAPGSSSGSGGGSSGGGGGGGGGGGW